MPLYSYQCQKCKGSVDVLQKHDQQRPPTPEELGEMACVDGGGAADHVWQKVIYPPKVAFGNGWSVTGGKGKGSW